MKQLQLLFVFALSAALTLGAGIMHGRLTQRWGVTSDMAAAGKRLEDKIPDQFGAWRVRAKDRLDEVSTQMLQCAGQAVRVYENEETGQVVSAVLIVGPMGPTAEHTPEVCFPSRMYRQIGERGRIKVGEVEGGKSDEIWVATFEETTVEGGLLRAGWAWTAGGTWDAASNPRVTYIAAPLLYKIQVQARIPATVLSAATDPCRLFLADFIPALRPIFSASGSSRE